MKLFFQINSIIFCLVSHCWNLFFTFSVAPNDLNTFEKWRFDWKECPDSRRSNPSEHHFSYSAPICNISRLSHFLLEKIIQRKIHVRERKENIKKNLWKWCAGVALIEIFTFKSIIQWKKSKTKYELLQYFLIVYDFIHNVFQTKNNWKL